MWLRTLILLVALFPISTFSAQVAQNADRYPIRGTVVNSLTGEPIRGALVQIYANRQRSVLTGADGSFQFADVPAGTVNLNVRKPGFFTAQAIQSPRAQAYFATSGPYQPPVVLKLIPEGLISGQINGDGGEPVEGLSVQIMEERVENGKKTRVILRGVQTDEQGEYRIAELQPGKYFVFVGASSRVNAFAAPPSQQGARGYAATFYPSGNDFATANPVEVAAGQQMQAGFRFDPAGGTFRTLWLPAGAYTLTAEMRNPENGQVYFASQNLNLTSDVAGVHLHSLPALNIP